MFKGKKWLIVKGILVLLYIIGSFFMDNSDPFDKFMRITASVAMFIVFLVDLSEYRETKK